MVRFPIRAGIFRSHLKSLWVERTEGPDTIRVIKNITTVPIFRLFYLFIINLGLEEGFGTMQVPIIGQPTGPELIETRNETGFQ